MSGSGRMRSSGAVKKSKDLATVSGSQPFPGAMPPRRALSQPEPPALPLRAHSSSPPRITPHVPFHLPRAILLCKRKRDDRYGHYEIGRLAK